MLAWLISIKNSQFKNAERLQQAQQKRQNDVTSLIDGKRQQLTEKQGNLKEWIHCKGNRRQQLIMMQ